MFGTIIMDAYTKDEVKNMADYIEESCSPLDNWGWASAGIYSFWDYDTKDILYIGLASDLYIRFKQHNGLLPLDEAACKKNQIDEYFKSHSKLGYTILVQSPLSQPIVQRNASKYQKFMNTSKGIPISDYAGEEGLEHIRLAEGQLIEACRISMGDIPPWNKVGGNVYARKFATEGNYVQIVKAFSTGNSRNFLVSRSTLRELAEDATYAWFENQLHGLRMMMLTLGMSFEESLKFQFNNNPYFASEWERIQSSGYLEKELII